MIDLVIGLYFLGIVAVSCESIEPSLALLKTTYCACRCCELDESINCFRHHSIPAHFKCSESTCNDKFCDIYEKAKCVKECFCKQCKSTLEADDYRCVSFKRLPFNCKCDKKIECEDKKYQAKELNNAVKSSSPMADNIECMLPCFCTVCKDSLPAGLYSHCLKERAPDKDCPCDTVKCPSQAVLEGLKKVQEMREKKEEAGSAHKFSDELDEVLTPEKARDAKCHMQCYCDVCSEDSDKIVASCEQMLPKPRVEGCKCDRDNIKCPGPTEDVDQHCKLYCFCKGCMKDPRMSFGMIQSCQEMTKKEQGCLCADKEKCDILDKLPDLNNSTPNKKMKKDKKGKLKPKKKAKDEL